MAGDFLEMSVTLPSDEHAAGLPVVIDGGGVLFRPPGRPSLLVDNEALIALVAALARYRRALDAAGSASLEDAEEVEG